MPVETSSVNMGLRRRQVVPVNGNFYTQLPCIVHSVVGYIRHLSVNLDRLLVKLLINATSVLSLSNISNAYDAL